MFICLPATGEAISGTYSAFWLGLPVGTVTISNSETLKADRHAYAFSMNLQSGGILGSSRFTTTFSGNGQTIGDTLRPEEGSFSDIRKGVERTEVILFGNDLPKFTSVPQYIIPDEFQFDAELTRGSLDPSSGLFLLLKSAAAGNCERQFRVYDGFSVYKATIHDEGEGYVRTRRYQGKAKKCRLALSPIAGKAAVFGSIAIPEMEVHVANLVAGAPALPVKGALIVNGQRAGLRLDEFRIQ